MLTRAAEAAMMVLLVAVVSLGTLARGQERLIDGYLPPPLSYLPPLADGYLPPPGSGGPVNSFDLSFALPPPNRPSTPVTERTPSTTRRRPTSVDTRRPVTSARRPSSLQPARTTPVPAASNPKVIFFEEDHYTNKATEPGFCNTFCGSVRDTIVQKPGRCPAVQPGPPRGLCKNECVYDSECPGGERCCNNGCANVCVVPDFRRTCADTNCGPGAACVDHLDRDSECVSVVPKPGLCPRYMNDSKPIGGCQDTCQYDSQCDGGAKCCWNGCSLKCLKPRKPGCAETKCKVGYKCEEDSFGNPQCKRIPCEQDGEIVDIECNSCTCIQGFLLCSQEECPPTKPGFCPRIVKGYKGRCVEECSSDYDCENESKCCSTGCGHTCQKPGKAIVHPCKTVRFRCGDDTRCAATRGLCQPGKPCPLSPLCVSNRVPYCESCPDGKVCVLQKKACYASGVCHRQPICIQLYSDDTPFEENEELEIAVVAKQQAARDSRQRTVNSIFN